LSGADPSLEQARALLQRGDLVAAAADLDAVCRDRPGSAEAHFLRGACCHTLGRLDEALQSFDRAVELDAANLQAAQGAIAVLTQLGRTEEALARGARLVESARDDPQLRFNLGLVHEAQSEFDRALACYDAALALAGDYRPALLNRGLALTRLGRLAEAHENNRRAAELYPALADSHFNLAEACLALSRYDEAIEHCDRALRLDPRHLGALFDRGLALAARGDIEEAEATFDRARRLDPARTHALEARVYPEREQARPIDAREVYLLRGFEALDACDWADRDRYLQRFAAWIDATDSRPLDALPLAWRAVALGMDQRRQAKLAAQVAARIVRSAKPLAPVDCRATSRIRIGYVSADFRAHTVAWLTEEVYPRHDRDRFEVFAYALTPDDGSPVRRRIASDVDAFRDVSGRAAAEIAAQVRTDGIDVAVDLTGYTTGARPEVFAMRPAPVTAAYLGFLGTSSAPFIDYMIVDRVGVPPGTEDQFSEQLAFLPDTLWCYGCPALTDTPPPRDAVGLPPHGFVFCAFHNAFKIGPEIFSRWMELLRRVPGSVLWVLARSPEAGRNLRREAERRGIDPGRIVSAPALPHDQHLARHAAADLFLDTPGFSAATTCLDALWQGLPVLGCPTATLAGRQSASALAALGLPELIARDLDDYVDRATRLATDAGALAAVRQRLDAARREAPLFDMTARVRELEAAFGAMVERARAGLPAASLEIARGGRDVTVSRTAR
jgi:predicted O-linked N-acetylglucosamine transferase (SPINDLY family)